MSHIPGPWTIEHIKGLDLGATAEIMAGKIVIAQVWKTDDAILGWSKDKTGQDNAFLIAAAHDLLEACKKAFNCLAYRAEMTQRKWTRLDQRAFEALQSAIAKAEGREVK